MKNNNTVDTAQKGQTTNKNNTPTGKIKTLKSTEERRKAREEQYRNFRINALKRRCKRMGISEEDTKKYVEKLIEQLNAPKEYNILILCKKDDNEMIKESLAKEGIKYNYCSDVHFSITGNQNILAKIRGFMPEGTTIHPYAKKMESVLANVKPIEKEKKPSNNTTEKQLAANKAGNKYRGSKRYFHRMQAGRMQTLADVRRAHRYAKKNLRKDEKINVQNVLEDAKKRKELREAKTVHMVNKKRSKSVKMAKKAA